MNIDNVNPFNIVSPSPTNVNKLDSINPVETQKPSFEEYLKNSLEGVNSLQVESENQTTLLATGQVDNVHDVTIAGAKAKVSLDLTMAVRNKVVEAYKEVMRMQV